MTMKEIKQNLCYYDKRNPDFLDPDTIGGEKIEPRKNCYCDNCFDGNDKLALEIIRLWEVIGVEKKQ